MFNPVSVWPLGRRAAHVQVHKHYTQSYKAVIKSSYHQTGSRREHKISAFQGQEPDVPKTVAYKSDFSIANKKACYLKQTLLLGLCVSEFQNVLSLQIRDL